MNLLVDANSDKSSGILMMIILFVAAVVVGHVGVIIGTDMGQVALLVGTFLVPVAGGQIGQALQNKGLGEMVTEKSLGVFQNSQGAVDVGRILKIVAVIVALELAVLTMILRAETGIMGVVQLCGAYLAYATASEITQKVAGI
jgi:hypothetical protein